MPWDDSASRGRDELRKQESHEHQFPEPNTREQERDQERVLVIRLREGDTQAFTTLVTQYVETITRFAFYIIRSHDAADDIAQNVFVSLWEHRTTIDETRPLKHYLFRAVRNRALNEQKSNIIRDRYRSEQQAEAETGTLQANVPSPEETVLTAETVQTAINELPERRQLALRLRIEEELTHAEIADILQITPEAAQRLVSRAVADLRKKLICLTDRS